MSRRRKTATPHSTAGVPEKPSVGWDQAHGESLETASFEKRSSESTPHDKPPLTPTEVNRVVNAAFQDDVLKCPAMKRAIEIAGKAHLARELGVAYQSMDKWPIRGMPRTEWTGETEYWRVIQFETGGQVTKEMLFKRSS